MVTSTSSNPSKNAFEKRLLFILPEAPFPPRKNGFSIRFYPLLRELSKQYKLDIALLSGNNLAPDIGDLAEIIESVTIIPNSAQPSILERLLAQISRISPWGVPYEFYRYRVNDSVTALLALHLDRYEKIIWACESHFLDVFSRSYHCKNLVIDAVDSMTLWKSRISKSHNLKDRLCLSKMRRWEASVLSRAQKVFYISDADAELMRRFLPKNHIQVMPNGVYFADYHDHKLSLPSPSIGYLGNMSYRPNIDAAMRVFTLYKKLKLKVPALSFYIIGRNPLPEITALGEEPGVTVTGTVDSIWDYVNGVDIFVLPMALGAGQQNKLLEILYAGKPAVVSSVANHGVKARDGIEVLVRNSEDEIVHATEQLISNSVLCDNLGQAGKHFVTQEYSWARIGQKYSNALNC